MIYALFAFVAVLIVLVVVLAHEREVHAERIERLLAGMAEERREWAAERTVLLNRIQDPAATAFASNVATMASPGDMSMDVTT